MNRTQGWAMANLYLIAFVCAAISWWSMLAMTLVAIAGCLTYWYVRRVAS